jgi:hypothetical protein
VHLPGMSLNEVRQQIAEIGCTVVASLRSNWPSPERGDQ